MTKTDLSGHEPRVVWSWNLSTVQVIFSLIGKLVGAAIIVWGMVQWSARYVFTTELERFHKEAVPQIERMIDSRVEMQGLRSETEMMAKLDEISQRLARIEGRMNGNRS